MAEHYDEMTLLLYLEEQLEAARVREIAAHMRECPACGALLRSLQHEGLWLRESLTAEDESIPARLMAAPAGADVPWGWVMSLGMGAAGIYGLWSGIVEPWQQRFTQAGFTQGNLLSMVFFSGALWKGWGEMRNIVEIMATVGVMVILAMLLRHNWRRWTTVGVVMGALGLALAMPPAAMAGEFGKGQPNYTLPAGQTIKTDLYAAGDYIRIDGDVNGDLFAFGHSVLVNGHVSGDVFGFSQSVTINGRVDGNVRTWAESVSIMGTVGKNVMAAGDSVDVDPRASVEGSVTAGAGRVVLNGPVGGDVMASAGSITFNGKVGGNVQLSSREMFVNSGADIHGGILYRGDQAPRIDPGAKVGGPVQQHYEQHVPDYKRGRYYWHMAFKWAAGFLFGLVLIFAVPAFFGDVLRSLDRAGIAGGVGVVTVIGIPVAAIIACVTIVGLAVGISTLLFYAITLYSAHVFVGAWIGKKILGEGNGSGAMLGRLAIGLAILSVVKLVPWLGAIVGAIVLVWGAGAVAYTIYRRVRPVLAAA